MNETMTKVRDLIQRDIGVTVEGVVKVFDRASLVTEMKEYVVTDKIEEELKRIFDTFTQVSETLRHGGHGAGRYGPVGVRFLRIGQVALRQGRWPPVSEHAV